LSCFLPIHVYDTASGRPVAMLLRTGKTPSGAEGAGCTSGAWCVISASTGPIPTSPSAAMGTMPVLIMAFCEAAGVDYVFGLPTNAALRADPAIAAAPPARSSGPGPTPVLRNYVETRYGAKLEEPTPRRRPD
jgi:hypothetical protein